MMDVCKTVEEEEPIKRRYSLKEIKAFHDWRQSFRPPEKRIPFKPDPRRKYTPEELKELE